MSALTQTSNWQAGFLNFLPAVQTHARIRFRRLPVEQREDAIQEALASACVSFQILAAKGQLHRARPSTIATFAINHVQNGRHVGGHQEGARDALSPVAQRRHGIKMASLSADDGLCGLLIADRRTDIPEMAAFRIDFGRWLSTFRRRDRRIITALASGERTSDLAKQFGVTDGRVSRLRRRYERA